MGFAREVIVELLPQPHLGRHRPPIGDRVSIGPHSRAGRVSRQQPVSVRRDTILAEPTCAPWDTRCMRLTATCVFPAACRARADLPRSAASLIRDAASDTDRCG
jgi:hypothetical protein